MSVSDMLLERVKMATLAMQRHNWEQGVVAQAFLEAGDVQTAVLMAVEGVNRQIDDGRCCMLGGHSAITDPCAIGEALITACEVTKDERLIEANSKLLKWALQNAPRNEEGIVYHLCSGREFWVDSFYMLPPYLAKAGYYDEALKQLNGYWNALFRPEIGLLAHRWDDESQTFVRRDAWGVGNGWALAGMARVIAMLPEEYAQQRALLIGCVETLLQNLIPYMTENGMCHDVLNDPQTFCEVNCGQMAAYTIYRGVHEGWLSERYISAAEKFYEAACKEVDGYGIVRHVCGAPSFDRPHVAPEGQAFFILMESARRVYLSALQR